MKKNSSFRIRLQEYLAKEFYPAKKKDWYKAKGYEGNKTDQFKSFLKSSRLSSSKNNQEFNQVDASRYSIKSGKEAIDLVFFAPKEDASRAKPAKGKCFVFFLGKGECYEGRFSDIAMQACSTGASICAFNHKGMHSSTGSILSLSDLVEDGIAAIDFVLQKKQIAPKNIILQGNSLGAGVQYLVGKYFEKERDVAFRQINSNSFSSVGSLFGDHYKMPFLSSFFGFLLKQIDWETNIGKDYLTTGVHRCFLSRKGDKAIKERSRFVNSVNIDKDCSYCPKEYDEVNRWLYENSELIYMGKSKKDPHFFSLNRMSLQDGSSVYDFINLYVTESDKNV